MKYIFENIVKTESIFLIVEEHFEGATEREHLKNIIRDTMHHQLVDLVLDELDFEKKTLFLMELDDETKHQNLLERLTGWIENFEEKLHLRARDAEAEMLSLFLEKN
jgi:hypothetical protein